MRLRQWLTVLLSAIVVATLPACRETAVPGSDKPDSEPVQNTPSAFLPPAGAGKAQPGAGQDRVVDWLDLMPAEERRALEAGEWPEVEIDHDAMGGTGQAGSRATVESMNGRQIRIPGYVVPIDVDEQQQMRSFFLVPYYGACIHVPPPPPNQIIYAELDTPIEVPSMWEAQWLTAELQTARFDGEIASSSYRALSPRLEPWSD
jgi:hypothetical protein